VVLLPKEVYEQLRRQAEEEGDSYSGYVRRLLIAAAKKQEK
jgi:predicted CopG family antitoxin